MLLRWCFLILALCFGASPAVAELVRAVEVGKRVALVVGNQDYAAMSSAFQTPRNEAIAVAERLEALGFEIVGGPDGGPLLDATEAQMVDAVTSLRDAAWSAELALLYYTGAGAQGPDGEDYLLPVDIDLTLGSAIRHEALSVGAILEEMKADHMMSDLPVLLVIDGGRRSITPNRGVGRGGSFVALSAGLPEETTIWYSSAAGQLAMDGTEPGGSGPFATAFLARFGAEGVDEIATFRAIRRDVVEATAGAQRPDMVGLLNDPLVITPEPDGTTTPVSQP